MNRRDFLARSGRATLALGAAGLFPRLGWAEGVPGPEQQDLAGAWRFRLDPQSMGREYETWFKTRLPAEIHLPSSTDEAGFGTRTTGYELGHLTRPWRYEGLAWYQRDIDVPEEWAEKRVTLFLERAHWSTTAWLDEREIGVQDSLCVPHVHELGTGLTPGRHQLTVKVDNRYLYDVGRDAHSVTDHTQTNWNGIVGRIELQATDPVWIDRLELYPEVEERRVRVEGVVKNATGSPREAELALEIVRAGGGGRSARASRRLGPVEEELPFSVTIPLGGEGVLWSEFDPALYEARATLRAVGTRFLDRRVETFGLRRIHTDGQRLLLNERPIFLRGNLECCIFPKTGHPPTDVESWARLFRIAHSHGLNHFRFHSYVPPEAAFIAADQAGFLVEVELPVWNSNIGRVPPRDAFLRAEGIRVQDAYGNHPSFVMMALGNELQGDWDFMNTLVEELKARDPRRLYTTHADHVRFRPEPSSDFYICQRTAATGKYLRLHGSERLQGPLGTDFDFSDYLASFEVPTISHEIGQWAVNPAYDHFERYTGPVQPTNLAYFRDQLADRGMLDLAQRMQLATGTFAWTLYKEDMESALRTPRMGGFQLLQLQDFPGQGEALIGLLDAFWETKGILTAEEFRRFCGPTVPLLRMEKFTWTADETFRATAQLRHHGTAPLRAATATWTIDDDEGRSLGSGRFGPLDVGYDLTTLGHFELPLEGVVTPRHLTIRLAVPEAGVENRWSIWVYPRTVDASAGEVLVAERYDDEVRRTLAEGGRVLLLSPPKQTGEMAIPSSFLPVFWSLSWFAAQPGTSSVLCDPSHPALASFPTAFHSDWQWREVLEPSKAFVLDEAPKDYQPVVRVIDDFHRNHRLAAVFETRVGRGRLLVSGLNLIDAGRSRPVARQLLHSLLGYARSERFVPSSELDPALLARLLQL
jgi:hypothetical protein